MKIVFFQEIIVFSDRVEHLVAEEALSALGLR